MDRVILKIPGVFKKGFVRTHVISITKGPSFKLNRNLTYFYDKELAVFSRNGTNYTSIFMAPLPGPAVIDLGITQVLLTKISLLKPAKNTWENANCRPSSTNASETERPRTSWTGGSRARS